MFFGVMPEMTGIQKLKYRSYLKSMSEMTILNDGDYTMITENNAELWTKKEEAPSIIILPPTDYGTESNIEPESTLD